jgi:hypothetical protein
MFRAIYRSIAALTLSAALAVTVVGTQDSAQTAPAAGADTPNNHWCC